jgi:hypothetical protein
MPRISRPMDIHKAVELVLHSRGKEYRGKGTPTVVEREWKTF